MSKIYIARPILVAALEQVTASRPVSLMTLTQYLRLNANMCH